MYGEGDTGRKHLLNDVYTVIESESWRNANPKVSEFFITNRKELRNKIGKYLTDVLAGTVKNNDTTIKFFRVYQSYRSVGILITKHNVEFYSGTLFFSTVNLTNNGADDDTIISLKTK